MADINTTSPPPPANAFWDRDGAGHRTITVLEQDPDRRDTGLLDQHGDKIWLVAVRQPIGFCR